LFLTTLCAPFKYISIYFSFCRAVLAGYGVLYLSPSATSFMLLHRLQHLFRFPAFTSTTLAQIFLWFLQFLQPLVTILTIALKPYRWLHGPTDTKIPVCEILCHAIWCKAIPVTTVKAYRVVRC
jgi:hypothetical protein